jgi:hypothetical protein
MRLPSSGAIFLWTGAERFVIHNRLYTFQPGGLDETIDVLALRDDHRRAI